MGITHLVYGDVHASPSSTQDRADLLANLMKDLRPDVVINLGDFGDFASLSEYEKGTAFFYGKNYRKDLDAHLEFEDRVWSPLRRQKKKLPTRIGIWGNHDFRIVRALSKKPELDGVISPKDLCLRDFYDIEIPYDGYGTPGTVEIDGVLYSHYIISGVSGRALAAQHQGFNLLQKKHSSVTVGHQHIFDYNVQAIQRDKTIHGLCAPCFTEEHFEWAGTISDLWNRGVVICHDVEDGHYDLEYVSLQRLKKEYGN